MNCNGFEFLPSLQMMELMYPLGSDFDAAEVIRRVAELDFYRAVETSVVTDDGKGKEIYSLCQESGLYWTCWASVYINAEGLNLSSVDSDERRRSVRRISELMDIAAQSGANAFSVLSGPRPREDALLPSAIAYACESMVELANRARACPDLRLLIEPLDRDVHKRGTIGTAREAAALIRQARQVNPEVYMVWDSSHMMLQERDLKGSLNAAGDTIGHVHLCNAVTEPGSELYGDYHLMPGAPGYLDEACAAEILRCISGMDLIPEGIPVAVEARPEADAWGAEEIARTFLKRAMEERAE